MSESYIQDLIEDAQKDLYKRTVMSQTETFIDDGHKNVIHIDDGHKNIVSTNLGRTVVTNWANKAPLTDLPIWKYAVLIGPECVIVEAESTTQAITIATIAIKRKHGAATVALMSVTVQRASYDLTI